MEQKQPDPFFKVIVRIDGRLQGAIYNLTKAHALHIAKRINASGLLPHATRTAMAHEMVAPRPLIETIHTIQHICDPQGCSREVTPRVVGTSESATHFLEKQLTVVTGYLPNR
jgi:hypothetical protein